MNKEEARLVRNLLRNLHNAMARFPGHLPQQHLKKSAEELRIVMIEQRFIRSKEFEALTDDGYPVIVNAATQWHADQVAER